MTTLVSVVGVAFTTEAEFTGMTFFHNARFRVATGQTPNPGFVRRQLLEPFVLEALALRPQNCDSMGRNLNLPGYLDAEEPQDRPVVGFLISEFIPSLTMSRKGARRENRTRKRLQPQALLSPGEEEL